MTCGVSALLSHALPVDLRSFISLRSMAQPLSLTNEAIPRGPGAMLPASRRNFQRSSVSGPE